MYRVGASGGLLTLRNDGLVLTDEEALMLVRTYKAIAEAIIAELAGEPDDA